MGAAKTYRGFILQPTYRIESGRPVVHLYGVLEGGGGFLVRDARRVPHFWIEEADARRAAALGVRPLTAGDRVTMSGAPVVRVEVRIPSDTPAVRDRLLEAGIACYEADVRFAVGYLIQRGIQGAVEITGEAQRREGVGLVFDQPELAPADFSPKLSVLSFDIETDPKARRLFSIAMDGCGVSEVMIFTPAGWEAPEGAVSFSSERELFAAFCRRVRELDPDVLTGWSVIDFDLATLANLAERFGMAFEIGRGPGAVRLRENRAGRERLQVTVPGRVVLDGLRLLRGAFVRMDSYALDFVAHQLLGEGKTVSGDDRGAEILDMFKHHRARLVDYNLQDAKLVSRILDKLHLVELAVERSRLTGMAPDRVAASIASFDFLYMGELCRRGVVAPTVGAVPPGGATTANFGGHVLQPKPGLHENVLVFDFRSLYPSLIRTFQIDPLGFLPPHEAGAEADPIVAPNGAAFRRQPGILTAILDRLFPRREEAKQRGDQVASQAIKILMNSFYGVLGTPACRFYNPLIAGAITSFGRELLIWMQGRCEKHGHRVLYGDTDSLFIESNLEEPEAALALAEDLVSRLNRELASHIERTWRVESRMELEFEKLYLRLVLPALRGGKGVGQRVGKGRGGAAKRYVGLVAAGGERPPEVVFTGMESVRRDWTELAKAVQRELYERLFHHRPVEDYLRGVVASLRAGHHDERLVYRKRLRKDPDAYTATTPPHVAAARRLAAAGRPKRRGLISYVMTQGGAEPIELPRQAGLDYEHYVEKQIRPVAEPVLALLGLEFKRVVGDENQLALF